MAVQEEYIRRECCPKDIDVQKNESIDSKLQKCVNTIVKEEGFITYEVIRTNIASDGANYLGGLMSADIKGETPEGYKELYIFFKLMNTEENLTIVFIDEVYLRELFVYTELSRVFSDIQDEFNVPKDEKYKLVRCFDRACSTDVIVLENMAKKGYTTPSRLEVVDLEYAKLAMKELAKLHGLSFAIQEKKPEYFNKKLRSLKFLQNFNEDWNTFVTDLGQMICKCIDGDHKKKLDAYVPSIMQKFRAYILDDDSRRCMCHFDFRPNNILMKKDKGEVTDLIPIDYQFVYYGCPALDVLYFIYVSTDQKFRRNHMTELKAYYYECLGTYLKYYDVDVHIVYPRKVFETDFAEKQDFGLMCAVIVLPLILTANNNDIDITNQVKKEVEFDESFKGRITEILDDFIEMGFL